MIAQHTKVHNYLESLIKQGREGDLLPSQSALCDRFEVSNITVRRALGDIEQKGLIFRKKGKGSFIRKRKPVVRNIKIFLIIPPNIMLDDDFISGIVSQSRKSRTGLYIYHYNHDDLELENTIDSSSPDGILWVTPDDAQSIGMAEKLREKGLAVMIFNRIVKNSHLNYISSNNSGGIKELTELFIAHGRKRIAFLGHDETLGFSHSRYLAFQKTVDETDADVKTFTIPVSCKGYQHGNLVEPVVDMLNTFNPDAILSSQGDFIVDLLTVIREKQLNIPQDIEVGTYNRIDSETPEKEFIHEIDQSIQVMGTLALIEIESIIKGIKGTSRLIMKPQVLTKELSS
jgi:GntR family transcriptional regulator, arabinose operon transcriptional repressor